VSIEREPDEQLVLVPATVGSPARRRPSRPPGGVAAVDPVAEVVVDVPLPHLDRPFEYGVPAAMDAQARPGVRVRVRFAGQDRPGFVVARKATAEHVGRLAPLLRVVSPEVVLTPALLALCRAVAERWAGTLGDVLRLAVPPRHAQAERADPSPAAPFSASSRPRPPAPGPWSALPGGTAFLQRLGRTESPRAVWTATPSAADPERDWPKAVAVAVGSAVAGERGALVVVPDARDVVRVSAALTDLDVDHVTLTADLGPRARYAAWLSVRRGLRRVVVGTRASAFAPVHDLGLVVCWDDGDDLHVERRAPYPHVREVLALRAEQEDAAALFGGFVRTAEGERLVQKGWARPLVAGPSALRASAPRVVLAGEGVEPGRDPAAGTARLPSLAWRTAQAALRSAPVLVQVPRRGYVPALACQGCRAHARCATCHGPLGLAGQDGAPTCGWCGRVQTPWVCPDCGDRRLRSVVVGAARTAHELGRAFPDVPVLRSGAGEVRERVSGAPALVVATPGAEPVADGGYGAALLLDAWALLGRSDLRAGEEALRRWMGAAALVRGSTEGGRVVLVGEASLPPVEALIRWGPVWHAEHELTERQALAFPPAACLVTLTGDLAAVQDLVAASALPVDVEVLGPIERPATSSGGREDPVFRVLLRVSPSGRAGLAQALRAGAAVRSAHKSPGSVRVQVDPLDLV
jgi:primosomal protein N' (replication factor Y) (superfamily II helicase)